MSIVGSRSILDTSTKRPLFSPVISTLPARVLSQASCEIDTALSNLTEIPISEQGQSHHSSVELSACHSQCSKMLLQQGLGLAFIKSVKKRTCHWNSSLKALPKHRSRQVPNTQQRNKEQETCILNWKYCFTQLSQDGITLFALQLTKKCFR